MDLINFIYIEDFSFNLFDFNLSDNYIHIECSNMSNGDVICDLHLSFVQEFSYFSNIDKNDPFSDDFLPSYMGELKLDFNKLTNLFELYLVGAITINIKSQKYSCVQFPFDENLLNSIEL